MSLNDAIKDNDILQVKLLLADARIDVTKANNEGMTPFYSACYRGHINIVKLLLENSDQIDVNKPNKSNETPLDVAYMNKHNEIVKLLLANDRIIIDSNKEYILS